VNRSRPWSRRIRPRLPHQMMQRLAVVSDRHPLREVRDRPASGSEKLAAEVTN